MLFSENKCVKSSYEFISVSFGCKRVSLKKSVLSFTIKFVSNIKSILIDLMWNEQGENQVPKVIP